MTRLEFELSFTIPPYAPMPINAFTFFRVTNSISKSLLIIKSSLYFSSRKSARDFDIFELNVFGYSLCMTYVFNIPYVIHVCQTFFFHYFRLLTLALRSHMTIMMSSTLTSVSQNVSVSFSLLSDVDSHAITLDLLIGLIFSSTRRTLSEAGHYRQNTLHTNSNINSTPLSFFTPDDSVANFLLFLYLGVKFRGAPNENEFTLRNLLLIINSKPFHSKLSDTV